MSITVTETFIPAGTRVGIAKSGERARYYDTKAEVIVEQHQAAVHPMIPDSFCRVTTAAGIYVFFDLSQLRTREVTPFVLPQTKLGTVVNDRAEEKAEFARVEAEQERAAYTAEMERDDAIQTAQADEQAAVQYTTYVPDPIQQTEQVLDTNERSWTVSRGRTGGTITIVSNLTDLQAAQACRRVPVGHADKAFATDLQALYYRSRLTPRQLPWMHKLGTDQIGRETGTTPATVQPAKVHYLSRKPICRFEALVKFLAPASKSLKSGAKLTFGNALDEATNGVTHSTVQFTRSKQNGSYLVTNGQPRYAGAQVVYGTIKENGDWHPTDECPAGLNALLDNFEADPVAFVREYGCRSGWCCFCNATLEDAISVQLGYGPVCGPKYGLPIGKKALKFFGLEGK